MNSKDDLIKISIIPTFGVSGGPLQNDNRETLNNRLHNPKVSEYDVPRDETMSKIISDYVFFLSIQQVNTKGLKFQFCHIDLTIAISDKTRVEDIDGMANGSVIYAYKTNVPPLVNNGSIGFQIYFQENFLKGYYEPAENTISSVVNDFILSYIIFQEDKVTPVEITFQFRDQIIYRSGVNQWHENFKLQNIPGFGDGAVVYAFVSNQL